MTLAQPGRKLLSSHNVPIPKEMTCVGLTIMSQCDLRLHKENLPISSRITAFPAFDPLQQGHWLQIQEYRLHRQ